MNPTESERWPDWRLDDLSDTVAALRDLPHRMALYERELKDMAEDVQEAKNEIHQLAGRWDDYLVKQERDRKMLEAQTEQAAAALRVERKKDRWAFVTTLIATSGVIVAAIGIFFQ
jgi:DNA repair ATPase RecN